MTFCIALFLRHWSTCIFADFGKCSKQLSDSDVVVMVILRAMY